MATFNQVTCIGRAGKMPELKVTKEGTPYLRFSLAVDQGKEQKPMWLNIVCWQDLAERVEKLLFTGAALFVQGRLQKRTYTDKNRMEREAFDIVASTIQLLERKRPQDKADDLPDEALPGS
jgi:single-strand DNA-binding protein